jgi:shikimate dehydrogenase
MNDKFGLIGFPLGHSFSKKYFTDKFTREGIAASYELFPLQDINELKSLVLKQPGLKGLNVTIPHKQVVIKLLDEVSGEVVTIKAVNTISIKTVNGKMVLKGWNTDAPAFESELIEFAGNKPSTALVLGTGGAAAAVKFVLNKLGWHYKSVSRTPMNHDEISYDELLDDLINSTRLIVNTTPLGMFPDVDSAPPIPYSQLTDNHYLFDLVYNPVETKFMSLGKSNGAKVINGLGMLHKQAELAWEIWQSEIAANKKA